MDQAYREMCQACDSKLVTHYISQPGAEPPSISLCDECMEAHTPVFLDDTRNAVCQYCGGGAKGSSIFPEDRPVCQSCSAEYLRISMGKLSKQALEAHMRRWVIQRDN